MKDIEQNIKWLNEEISLVKKRCGREGEEITLVAVTKTHPVDTIDFALKCGITHIGENKVQEAIRKIPLLSRPYEGFHFIGHLQSNKINQLLSLKPFLIHSIDSLYLADKLNRALGRINRIQDILVQVNTTLEPQKSGVSFENAKELVIKIASMASLRVRGLMTIGKLDPDPEVSRPYFKQLKGILEELKAEGIEGLEYLSMGMSHDFRIAIEEGANMLRIGSTIFGERDYGGRK